MWRNLLTLLAVLAATLPALAQDNPVTNGSFETLDAQGKPVDWEFLGSVKVVPEAHTGQRALLLERAANEKNEIGLNRRWSINSGEQGAMLSELKGGLEFWYQALAAEPGARLTVGLIGMTATPLEGTGAGRVMFEVPPAYVGDGQWHRGLVKYDFTEYATAKWVHVAARLTGGAGKLLLDDLRWVQSVGPLLKVRKLDLVETPGQEGEAGTVRALVANIGDVPLQAATASLILPGYLKTDAAQRSVPPTAPDQFTRLEWPLTGLRDRTDTLTVRVASGDQVAEAKLSLAADLEVEQLRADRFLLTPGEKTALRLLVTNHGNAAAPGLTAHLAVAAGPFVTVADGAPRQLPLVRPGGQASTTWEATVRAIMPGTCLEATLKDGPNTVGRALTELVGAPPLPKVPALKPGATAQVWDTGAVVGNAQTRLVLAVDSQRRARPGWLQVSRGGTWQTVGVLPALGYVSLSPASKGGERRALLARVSRAEGATLQLSDAGASWTFEAGQGPEITMRLQYKPAAGQPLYGVIGPLLYVGEGSWGGAKTEALFPGLEWLTPDEVSSSTLDIAAKMPQRWRWCPPPHAVTIPCASIYHDGVTVGLLWDQLQQCAGAETRPRAVFGAPDRFEGRNACVLGLLAPGGADPEWWIPPRLATEEPLALTANQSVNLTCRLYAATGTTDAMAAVDRWVALYGVPRPQRLPHGKSHAEEISFSAQGYLKSLVDPKTGKWFASLNGPQMMAGLGWHAPYLYDTLYASRLASDPQVRRDCEALAAEVARQGNVRPQADDLGFEFGDAAAALIGQGDVAQSLIRSQGPDGSWRFSARIERSGIFAGMDYGELGPDRAAEVGTCAHNAYQILRYARMTGDAAAREAGLRALAFMAQFTVPRAAQVWEVPVHTPDVLASADACEAYLEGYALTGDKAYLKRAVFWARTGLPFFYLWDTPGYEALRYASIPVFGASWYTCNWFGQPVQWNGLRLARAYLRLAPLDDSYPWHTLAEGLTISGMWQQHGPQTGGQDMWPDTKDKWAGLWPDNFNSVDLKRCPWVFAPRQILDLVYRLEGMQPDPLTMTARQGDQTLRVSACAALSDVSWQGDKLALTARCVAPQTSQIVVCNLAPPGAVTVNGTALPPTPRLATVATPGWEYLPSYKLLVVRPPAGAVAKLEVTGARFEAGSLAPPLATRLDFDFSAGIEGWRAAHDLAAPMAEGDSVVLQTTGTDPYFIRTGVDLAPGTPGMVVRLAASPDTVGQLQVFWATEKSPSFDEAKSVKVDLIADDQMHDYAVRLANHPQWAGQRITGLRLDPGNGPVGATLRLRSVKPLP